MIAPFRDVSHFRFGYAVVNDETLKAVTVHPTLLDDFPRRCSSPRAHLTRLLSHQLVKIDLRFEYNLGERFELDPARARGDKTRPESLTEIRKS